jgi:phosphatidylinositol glycan class B
VRAYLIASLLAIGVTAYFSVTFFHPDEHFQVLEFVGYKLGTTTSAELTWEFHCRMRPWLQPGAYYAIARGAEILGVRDAFAIAFLLRLASGILAWTAIVCMVRTALRWSIDPATRLAQLRVTTLLGFLPYLSVRTSSENVSCSLVTIGFCVVVDALRATSQLPAKVALIAGMLFGLAFESRFQTAILVAGLLAWLCVFRRIRAGSLLAFAGGGTAALLLGLFFDRWGYGEWTFPPYHYVRRNLIDRVASSQFGVDPFYGYLYLLLSNVFAPVVLGLMVGLILTWVRRPKHPVTWLTLPYAAIHCALAHKEERFFFPMLLVSTTSVTLGLSPAHRLSRLPGLLVGLARHADGLARRIWECRRSPLFSFVAAVNLLGLVLLAVYPLGWRPDVNFYDYVYHRVEPGAHIWKSGQWDLSDYPFYRRSTWHATPLSAGSDLAESVGRGEPTYLVTGLPYEAVDPSELGVCLELVYSEFPGWRNARVRALIGSCLPTVVRALDRVPGLPKAKWLTLYRLRPAEASSGVVEPR